MTSSSSGLEFAAPGRKQMISSVGDALSAHQCCTVCPALHVSASSCGNLVIPRACRRMNDRAFSIATPRTWNRLPTDRKLLRLIDSQKYHFNTTNILTLTFRSLSETCIRRSLFNYFSGSCHDSDGTWQEIGRMCGSACSSPRPGSRIAVLLFEYALPL